MRQRTVALVTASALAVAGCGLHGGDDETPDQKPAAGNEESNGAFRFASGDLPLGSFDRDKRFVEGFNPCEKISEEELSKVGLEATYRQSNFYGSAMNCVVNDLETDFFAELTFGRTTLDSILASGDEELETNSKVPGAKNFSGLASNYVMCATAVETTRGVFGVRIASEDTDTPMEDLCARSDELLDAFYELG